MAKFHEAQGLAMGVLLCGAGCGGSSGIANAVLPRDTKTITVRYYNAEPSSQVFQTNLPSPHTFTLASGAENDEAVTLSFTIGTSENLVVSAGSSSKSFNTTNTYNFNDANLHNIAVLDANLTQSGINFVVASS